MFKLLLVPIGRLVSPTIAGFAMEKSTQVSEKQIGVKSWYALVLNYSKIIVLGNLPDGRNILRWSELRTTIFERRTWGEHTHERADDQEPMDIKKISAKLWRR